MDIQKFYFVFETYGSGLVFFPPCKPCGYGSGLVFHHGNHVTSSEYDSSNSDINLMTGPNVSFLNSVHTVTQCID